MRIHHLCASLLVSVCLDIYPVSGLVALRGRPPGLTAEDQPAHYKRQPSTPQAQGTIDTVPTPGQQTQDVTSTAGAGSGAQNEPGVITNSPPTDNEVDCWNITTGRDNKCWGQLGLTAWMEDWVDKTPCHPNEAFASCFLRIEGFPGLDCTGIKIDACTAPQSDNLLKEPEVFYVAYNIYGKLLSIALHRCIKNSNLTHRLFSRQSILPFMVDRSRRRGKHCSRQRWRHSSATRSYQRRRYHPGRGTDYPHRRFCSCAWWFVPYASLR